MGYIRVASLIVGCNLLFAYAIAETPDELLIPVSQEELAQVQQSNEYFLKARLYFAKRHRIVRINESVLESDQPFIISLFPDTQITVKRDSVEIEPNTLIYWKGKIIDPPFATSALANSGFPEKEAEEIWESAVGLSIAGVVYDRDIATNQSFPARHERSAQGFKRPEDTSRIEKSAFYSVAINILSPPLNGNYKIRSLEATPDYHVVYEFDMSRRFSRKPSTDEENERKRANYEAYMKSLGEDPRNRWALRHKESK